MFKKLIIPVAALVCVLMLATTATAAPGLLITKPPVISGANQNTGPPIDPAASRGQWFYDLRTGNQNVRWCEFYDNVDDFGGGGPSCFAIEGYITQVFFDGQNKMTGFLMDVCITNNMPSAVPWRKGSNSHGEELDTNVQIGEQDEVTMLDVKWVAEFADNAIIGDFPNTGPPHLPAVPPNDWAGSNESNIFAEQFNQEEGGYDQLAWYCWTPNGDPGGWYRLPTWDFGDIDPGQTVCRTIRFHLRSPVPENQLAVFIWSAYTNQWDILLNRTSSLKISEYFDSFNVVDWCIPYPGETEPPASSSNCSVFFNTEEEPPPAPQIVDMERDSATGSGALTITWLGAPNPGQLYRIESSTDPYDYNESLMAWWIVADNIPSAPFMTWTDPSPPTAAGQEKYYRVVAKYIYGDVLGPDTVGAYVVPVFNGRNLVSSPFEPYPPGGGLLGPGTMGVSSLDKIIDSQLMGHPVSQWASDQVAAWDADAQTYVLAWLRTGQGWRAWDSMDDPPTFGMDSDKGYWFIINNTPTNVTFFGRVSKANRTIPMKANRNMVGTCFPVSCPLTSSNLVGSGFTGHPVSQWASDKIDFWDAAAQTYVGVWYRISHGWRQWDSMDLAPVPPYDEFAPGTGSWITVNNTPFDWIVPKPY